VSVGLSTPSRVTPTMSSQASTFICARAQNQRMLRAQNQRMLRLGAMTTILIRKSSTMGTRRPERLLARYEGRDGAGRALPRGLYAHLRELLELRDIVGQVRPANHSQIGVSAAFSQKMMRWLMRFLSMTPQ
jgi:hypothetical protein